MSKQTLKWISPVLLACFAFLSDLISKLWANKNLCLGESKEFVPGLLQLTLTRNTGGAFGIGKGHGLFMTFLASSIVIALLFWLYKKEKSESPPHALERCGIAIIIGAALGNLFDRLTRGEVTDFLQFAFIDFPVFNVSDALIDVGAALVIVSALFCSAKSKPAP